MGNVVASIQQELMVNAYSKGIKIADNIGELLQDINLLNYLSIHCLYTPHYYLYFELDNRDFFENVTQEEIQYIPSDYIKIRLYRIKYQNKDQLRQHRQLLIFYNHFATTSLNEDKHSSENNEKTISNFVLPKDIMENKERCKIWKILNVKSFYVLFSKAKKECHLHQLMLEEDQKKQANKFNRENISSSLLLETVDSNNLSKSSSKLLESSLLTDSQLTTGEEEVCAICLDAKPTIITGCCSSQFCEKCLKEWNKRNCTCPMCRRPLNINKQPKESWVTISKEEAILPREQVASNFINFINSLLVAKQEECN
ncbi:hypothetical protein ABK040_009799 [Willaertia magna]